MTTKDPAILAILERIALHKHQELLVNIPVREYSERTYPNFLSFTNAVKVATEPLQVTDSELVQCIKNRLVGVDYQIAEIYLEQENRKGRVPTSTEFIATMNQLITGQSNYTRWENLRLQQENVDFFDFKSYATRKFLAISKTQAQRDTKSILEEVALYALPAVSQSLLAQIEKGNIREFPELLNEGRRLTNLYLNDSPLLADYDSEIQQKNFLTQPNHGFRNVSNPYYGRHRDGYRQDPKYRPGQNPYSQGNQHHYANQTRSFSNEFSPPLNSNPALPNQERPAIVDRSFNCQYNNRPTNSEGVYKRPIILNRTAIEKESNAREINEFISNEIKQREEQVKNGQFRPAEFTSSVNPPITTEYRVATTGRTAGQNYMIQEIPEDEWPTSEDDTAPEETGEESDMASETEELLPNEEESDYEGDESDFAECDGVYIKGTASEGTDEESNPFNKTIDLTFAESDSDRIELEQTHHEDEAEDELFNCLEAKPDASSPASMHELMIESPTRFVEQKIAKPFQSEIESCESNFPMFVYIVDRPSANECPPPTPTDNSPTIEGAREPLIELDQQPSSNEAEQQKVNETTEGYELSHESTFERISKSSHKQSSDANEHRHAPAPKRSTISNESVQTGRAWRSLWPTTT